MSESTPIYLTSVSYGLVLSDKPNGQPSGVVAKHKGEGDVEAQKWIVEYDESDSNKIALRCCSNDDYLHADVGDNWAAARTGQKQWWKISNEDVTPPGACRLSPVDYPKVFLNHFQGQWVPKGHPGMKVHMWQWEQPHEYCLAWYFVDASKGFNPRESGDGAQSEEAQAKLKDLEEREAAIAKREKDTDARETKVKDLEKRETDMAKREKDVDARDAKLKDVEQREATVAKREKESSASDSTKSKDLEKREAAIAKREKELEARDAKLKDIEQREAAVTKKEQGSDSESDGQLASLKEREEAVAAQEKDLARQKAALEKREAKLASDSATNDKSNVPAKDPAKDSETELLKAENTNLKLQLRIKELEEKLKDDMQPLPTSTISRAQPQVKNEGSQAIPSTPAKVNKEPQSPNTAKPRAKLPGSDANEKSGSIQTSKSTGSDGDKASSNLPARVNPPGDDHVEFECGHKAYPPPRKLRRKLIGYMYE